MRSSPVIAFGLFAAITVCPGLATPIEVLSPRDGRVDIANSSTRHLLARQIPDTPNYPSLIASLPVSNSNIHRRYRKITRGVGSGGLFEEDGHLRKRAGDSATAGGNAYTGSASNADGGKIINHATSGGEVDNDGGNTAGQGGTSETGNANGGNGDGHGAGGNAYTGEAGNALGGEVSNEGGTINNGAGANQGGNGGFSSSGTAEGGSGEEGNTSDDDDSDIDFDNIF